MQYLGIDYGDRRVGIAVADGRQAMATPLTTMENGTDLLGRVVKICQKRSVSAVVIGESKTHAGVDNAIMEAIKHFKAALEKKLDIPVIFEPEFYTSSQARRQPDAKTHVDGSAAAIILQSYLDKIDM